MQTALRWNKNGSFRFSRYYKIPATAQQTAYIFQTEMAYPMMGNDIMPRTEAVSREHLVYGNSSLHLQPIRTMAIPGTTTSLATTLLAEADDEKVATAVRFCADQARELRFKPLEPRIHPGIEICNDRPAVRKAAEPLVQCFKSVHWVVRWRLSDGEVPLTHWLTDPQMDQGNYPAGTRRLHIFRAIPPATLHVKEGISTTIIPLLRPIRVNDVVINALHANNQGTNQVSYGHITKSSLIEHVDGPDPAVPYVFVVYHQDPSVL